MRNGAIRIQEILIQGNKGQAKLIFSLDNIIRDQGNSDPSRVDEVIELIRSIAATTARNHIKDQVTRAITDEFSFYLKNTPFTLDEYKEIIKQTASIAGRLPADVHLVLATFPVIWPDGRMLNCGLYVQAPSIAGQPAIIHHFQKKIASPIDFEYQKMDGTRYPLSSSTADAPEYHPNVVLKGTPVSINDTKQNDSALKLTTSDGKSFITSIGICIDHAMGVERQQVHGLIDKLQMAHQEVPLHCSHVIVSASIEEDSQHTLSSVSHADPDVIYRRPHKYPTRNGFTPDTLPSPFSKNELTVEIYPAKFIGTLHSDLFQHIIANQTPESLKIYLNEQDENANTLLHLVFLETDFDNELIAKRLYALVLNGADPDIKNSKGESARDLANAYPMATRAISSALAWQARIALHNRSLPEDKCTPLTRELRAGLVKKKRVYGYILDGANPYVKDAMGQTAMEIIRTVSDPPAQVTITGWINDTFKLTQYGNFHTLHTSPPLITSTWFALPPPLAADEFSSEADLIEAIDTGLWDLVSEMIAMAETNLLSSKSIEIAMYRAIVNKKEEVLTKILAMTGGKKPPPNTVFCMLDSAVQQSNLKAVEILLALQGDNKPTEHRVNNLLKLAVYNNPTRWELVPSFLAMTGDNKPNLEMVEHTLDYLFSEEKREFERVSERPPNTYHNLFNKYQFIQKFIDMPLENKPRQKLIDKLLLSVVEIGHLERAKMLFAMTGDNKPSKSCTARAKKQIIAFLEKNVWEGNFHLHIAAEKGIDALNQLLPILDPPIIPKQILCECLLTRNKTGLTPIHVLYKKIFNQKGYQALSSINISQLLYETYLAFEETKPENKYQDLIIKCLSLLASEAKHPEAWMAMALIDFHTKTITPAANEASAGSVTLADPAAITDADNYEIYINKIKTLIAPKSSALGLFDNNKTTKELCLALLLAKPELITKAKTDSRNVKGFIEQHLKTIKELRGLYHQEPPKSGPSIPIPK